MIPTLLHHAAAVVDTSGLPNSGSGDPTANIIGVVLSIVFAVTASISLLMIVIGGFRYITAHGDPHGTAEAKNTIIYAIVGLLVTMVAFSIVTFVVKGIG